MWPDRGPPATEDVLSAMMLPGYEIAEKIGENQVSTVYRGRALKDGRAVIVKTLRTIIRPCPWWPAMKTNSPLHGPRIFPNLRDPWPSSDTKTGRYSFTRTSVLAVWTP